MKNSIDYKYYDFILPAFENEEKYTFIVAGRRVGKTFASFQWILENLIYKQSKGLWVDTTQTNLSTYRNDHIKEILKEEYQNLKIDNQKNIIHFKNGSRLDMRSAERPELLEGFEYDWVVLNEAGIILKKQGLWENSIMPMCKNAKVKIVGTPKGKNKYYQLVEDFKENKNAKMFHYTIYDCPRYTAEEIEEIRNSTSAYTFDSEYLAMFTDAYENSLITETDLRYYETLPIDIQINSVSIHADLTHTAKTTSDYFSLIAIGKGSDNKYYELERVLEKMDQVEQMKVIINVYHKVKQYDIISFTYDAVSNDAFEERIKTYAREKYDLHLPIVAKKSGSDKVYNFQQVLPIIKANSFYMNTHLAQFSEANKQILAFPNKNVHDDYVDAVSHSLLGFNSGNRRLTDEEQSFWSVE